MRTLEGDHAPMPCRFGEDYSLAFLVDDCKLLGSLLDDALKTEVGEELFNKVGRGEGMRTGECRRPRSANPLTLVPPSYRSWNASVRWRNVLQSWRARTTRCAGTRVVGTPRALCRPNMCQKCG